MSSPIRISSELTPQPSPASLLKVIGAVQIEKGSYKLDVWPETGRVLEGEAYISMLSINPAFYGLGVGGDLLRAAEAYAVWRWDARRIKLWAFEPSGRAAYYAKRGYNDQNVKGAVEDIVPRDQWELLIVVDEAGEPVIRGQNFTNMVKELGEAAVTVAKQSYGWQPKAEVKWPPVLQSGEVLCLSAHAALQTLADDPDVGRDAATRKNHQRDHALLERLRALGDGA